MTFDAEALLNQSVEGPMATYMAPPPEGEYLARIGSEQTDLALDPITGKKDPTKTYTRLTIMWDIIDENLKSALGRDKIRVRDSFLIDVDASTGMLKNGPEDNVTLGSRRAAVGLNDGGPFNLNMLRGAGPCMVRIGHRSDERDPTRKYAEIARATPLSR